MREPSADAEPHTVFVLAQQGTPDTRSLQPLAPLVTLPELHAKLWVSSNGGKEQATTLSTSLPGHIGKPRVGLLRQTSARSKQSVARSARSEAVGARPATNLSSKLHVPDYVNPMLWAAALQEEAMQGHGQAGLTDSRLSTVLDLQDSMLAQVEQYKQLAPLLQDYKQPQHPMLRAVRKLPPGTVPGEDATQAAAPSRSQEPTKSSPAATPATATAAGASAGPPTVTAAAVTLLPLQQISSLAGRLEAACQQVIQDVPGITPTDTPTSGGHVGTAVTSRRLHQHSRVQLHTHRSHKGPKTARVHISSHNGTSSPRQQQQQQVSSPSAAGSARPPMLLLDKDSHPGQACSSSTPGTCHTLRSGIWSVSPAALKPSRDDNQVQPNISPGLQPMQQPQQQQQQQRQRQQSPLRGDLQQQLRPYDYAAVPFKLQHLRQEVLQEPSSLRGRGDTAAGSPGGKQGPCQSPASTLQVLQAQLDPGALEALKTSTAASVQEQLQRYHAHLLDTQQQLLQRELTLQHAQQQSEQQHVHGPGSRTGLISSRDITRSGAGSPVSCAAAEAVAAAGTSAAELTMQQLVARLAQRDVRQDEQQQSPDPASSSDPGGLTAAINRRVAAAGSLSELLDAANEHLNLAAQGSGFRLDIGRIARLQKIGKQWLSDASPARSTGSGTGRSKGRDGGATGCSTDRSHDADAATDRSNVPSSSSSSPMQSAREGKVTTASPVPCPVPSGASAHPAAHLAAARAGAVSSVTKPAAASGDQAAAAADQAGTSAAAGLVRRASCLGSDQAGLSAAAAGGGGAQRRASCLGSQRASIAGVAPAVAACASTSSMASVSAHPRSSTDPDSSSSSSALPAGSTAHHRSSTDFDNRLPAAMKASPPQLQPPSVSEVSALPMPSLPQLLDLSHEPVKVLQARLERVWEVLGVPADQQLDMVLRYTSRAAAIQFESVLDAWESAAAAVLQREAILAQVLQLQALLDQYAAQQQQQQVLWHSSHRVSTCSTGASSMSNAAGSPVEFELGVTVQQVRQVLWAFMAAEQQVQLAARQLYDAVGEQLQVECCVYPPEDSGFSLAELQELLTAAWVAAGSGHSS